MPTFKTAHANTSKEELPKTPLSAGDHVSEASGNLQANILAARREADEASKQAEKLKAELVVDRREAAEATKSRDEDARNLSGAINVGANQTANLKKELGTGYVSDARHQNSSKKMPPQRWEAGIVRKLKSMFQKADPYKSGNVSKTTAENILLILGTWTGNTLDQFLALVETDAGRIDYEAVCDWIVDFARPEALGDSPRHVDLECELRRESEYWKEQGGRSEHKLKFARYKVADSPKVMAANEAHVAGEEKVTNWSCSNQMMLVSVRDVSRIHQECGLSKEQSSQIIDKMKIRSEGIPTVKQHDDDTEDIEDIIRDIEDIIRDALQNIFSKCDADNSGYADFHELVDALEMYDELGRECGFPQIIKNVDHAYVKQFLRDADENYDQGLSWDEFLKHMARLTKEKMSSANAIIMNMPITTSSDAPTNLDEDLGITQALLEWQMDYWSLDENQQLKIVVQAFRHFQVLKHELMPLDLGRFSAFFSSVKSAYNDVPYHNFFHALTTMHFSLKLVQAAGMTAKLLPSHLFSLVLSALCHDIGHRGRNTAFEVQSKSELAMRYNDRSPLESHHCARAFEIAFQTPADECNIFQGWNQEEYSRVRKLMVSIILGTDMAFHNDHVTKLSAMKEVPDQLTPEGAEFLLEIFVHSADIGNPIMPTELSTRWGKAIADEFTAQVADERMLGLPVSKFMDGLEDPLKAVKSQLGFFDFVASPLFNPLFRLFPGLSEAQDNLTKNRERLQKESTNLGRTKSGQVIT